MRRLGSVNYGNKLPLQFSAAFKFIYYAKQTKPKQNKAQRGYFLTQIILSSEQSGDVRCEVLMSVMFV